MIVGQENAVELFYITSGFLISYVLQNNAGYRNAGRFYLSRALRLYPVYYVVAALALPAIAIGKPHFAELYRSIPPDATILLAMRSFPSRGIVQEG